MATATLERIQKTQEKLAQLKRSLAKEEATAAKRMSGKAKQCAMITFNILAQQNPDVLTWVESQLKRPQDVAAFQEWRNNIAPAAAPAKTTGHSTPPPVSLIAK